MTENPLSPKTEKTPGNPWLSWPMVALVLLGAGYYFGIKMMQSRAANLHFIFHQTGDGWEQVRTPAGYPDTLRVTSGGTVWVRTWGTSALSRWDGKAWHYVTAAELPERTSYKDNEFALDGEQVWAPTEEGVLHFDGQHWQSRRSLASAQARDSYGSALEYLGDALMEQGRYDEAMRSYEAALHAFP